MSEHRHYTQEKPHGGDPKERLFMFTTALFSKLHPKYKNESSTDKYKATKSFVSLDDGSEVGLTREIILPSTEDEADLITLVHRKKDPNTGQVRDYLYGVNADAIAARLRRQEHNPVDLQLFMNDAALSEVQITPAEAIKANIAPHEVVMASMQHIETHDAAGEEIMAKLLGEVMRRPDDDWHNNWAVKLPDAA